MLRCFTILSILFVLFSCKKEKETGKLCFTRTDTELIMENKTDKEIYFLAFGQQILPLVDWIQACGDNNLTPKSLKTQSLTSLIGYSETDSLVVYWWECEGNNPKELKSVALTKNQTACQ